MIDTHCHILWGIDDGAKDRWECIEMLKSAAKDGIQIIAATSHIKEPIFNNDKDRLHKAKVELEKAIEKHQIGIQIITGAENFVSFSTMHKLKEHQFVPYENSNYLLVEFSWTINMRDHPTRFLHAIIKEGYRPVIAHPERYQWVHQDYSLLKTWQKMGCLLQVNRTSILGLDKREKANQIVKTMLEDGLVDVIASDAHHPYEPRVAKLSDVYQSIASTYGKSKADLYFYHNPAKIIGQ